jgi:long-subunit fatty acid transport protein
MFLKLVKSFLFVSTSVFITSTANAQNITRSFENAPFSRYGVGEEVNAINPALKSMGSITSAYADPYTINTDNPASYATLKYVTYEAGATMSSRTVLAGDQKYKTGAANLSYLTIGVPLGKNGGMVIGYRPMTNVGYTLNDTTQTLIGKSVNSYTGKGGLNYFYIGGAGKYKGFSLGANLGYLFGTIQNASLLQNIDTTYNNNSEFSKYSQTGGLYFKLGALYEAEISDEYTLRIGGTLALSQKINSELNDYWISHPSYATDTSGSDTAYNASKVKTKLTLPMRYSLGVQLAKSDQLLVGIDYTYTNWSQFNNSSFQDSIGKSAYKLSVGAEYTPNSTSLYKYWQRANYRIGFYYGQDYVSINSKQMNYYAITFGIGLPFKRTNDRIQTSMEIGRIGTQSSDLIKQNFIRFSLGISLSDRSWFQKRKYD